MLEDRGLRIEDRGDHEMKLLFGWRRFLLLGVSMLIGHTPFAAGADVKPLLARIKSIEAKGKGNETAMAAWRELTKAGPDALLDVFTALDDANPIAGNWLRAAVEAIVDRALADGKKLPAAALEKLVLDKSHAGPARRLAYECLTRVDKTAQGRLIPGMLDDPSAELRRDAVALAIADAEKQVPDKDKAAAVTAFRKAFQAARDRDQVELIAKRLKELAAPVDLTAQFGFITEWLVIGPFDNSRGVGFAAVYPPEQEIKPAASYEGKNKKPLRWIEHTTRLPYGMVDLNTALGKNMGATGYALTLVTSAEKRPVQIRVGSNNAVKIFVNGKQIYFREEYHHGMRMDQHVGVATLKAGINQVLVKICQNEQTDSWAQLWSFQLRITDAIGGRVPVTLALKTSARTNEGGKKQ
jgi:hypothetical protein